MTYLLDTNVVSALRIPHRNPPVLRWAQTRDLNQMWLASVTIGEVEKGIARQADLSVARVLSAWVDGLLADFEGRVIAIGIEEARAWGRLVGPLEARGLNPAAVDSQIAATALVHGLAVVTRNVRHFQRFGVPVINPWGDEDGA